MRLARASSSGGRRVVPFEHEALALFGRQHVTLAHARGVRWKAVDRKKQSRAAIRVRLRRDVPILVPGVRFDCIDSHV
jgi:hypothetical protein